MPQWRNAINKADRMVALVLALVWMGGGGFGIALGYCQNRRLVISSGLVAIFYGVIWIRVACEGRKLTIGEAMRPWRRS